MRIATKVKDIVVQGYNKCSWYRLNKAFFINLPNGNLINLNGKLSEYYDNIVMATFFEFSPEETTVIYGADEMGKICNVHQCYIFDEGSNDHAFLLRSIGYDVADHNPCEEVRIDNLPIGVRVDESSDKTENCLKSQKEKKMEVTEVDGNKITLTLSDGEIQLLVQYAVTEILKKYIEEEEEKDLAEEKLPEIQCRWCGGTNGDILIYEDNGHTFPFHRGCYVEYTKRRSGN